MSLSPVVCLNGGPGGPTKTIVKKQLMQINATSLIYKAIITSIYIGMNSKWLTVLHRASLIIGILKNTTVDLDKVLFQ